MDTTAPDGGRRRRMAVDAPNLDMTLTNLLGSKPNRDQRPDLAALARWFARREPAAHNEAAVFANVPVVPPDGLQQWFMFLTGAGYDVFAKPKSGPSDIDDELLAYATEDGLTEVAVVSTDARLLHEPLERLAAAGVVVTVLGFAEFAGSLLRAEGVRFLDITDVPGVLTIDLPRIVLAALPPEGRWFRARAPLGGDEPVDDGLRP